MIIYFWVTRSWWCWPRRSSMLRPSRGSKVASYSTTGSLIFLQKLWLPTWFHRNMRSCGTSSRMAVLSAAVISKNSLRKCSVPKMSCLLSSASSYTFSAFRGSCCRTSRREEPQFPRKLLKKRARLSAMSCMATSSRRMNMKTSWTWRRVIATSRYWTRTSTWKSCFSSSTHSDTTTTRLKISFTTSLKSSTTVWQSSTTALKRTICTRATTRTLSWTPLGETPNSKFNDFGTLYHFINFLA